MPRRKLNYKEGDWFAVPLHGGGYALGLAARIDGSGGIVGYYFGPRCETIPTLGDAERESLREPVLITKSGDLGLLDGRWLVLGRLPGWRREEWPIPVFRRRSLHNPARAVRVYYSDEKFIGPLREEPVSADEVEGLPDDGMAGAVWVERRLAKLLPLERPMPSSPSDEVQLETFPHRRRSEMAMDEKRFWRLIDGAKRQAQGDIDRQVELLVEKLTKLPKREIVAFDQALRQLMALSYNRRLWAACYIINGGCSDDGFDYFRGWLIAQGEAVFANALRDPESLVGVAKPDAECEDMLYAASTAYQAKTGDAIPPADGVTVELKGEQWQEDDLPKLFPQLWAAFGQQHS